ncbi:MAG: ABC transporter permease [Ruminococcus sp.]|nr:ABC transporter permease [Ruminococcus sp.]
MKNPLIRRIPRELKSEPGKQLAVFLFFVLIISAVSGFIVSADSLKEAYDETFEKYNIEHGNFELMQKADEQTFSDIEEEGDITLYENFYKQEETKGFDSKLRIFGQRDDVDRVCLLSGEMPYEENEIAIDRLYAKNHDLERGSEIEIEGAVLKVTGIVALSDYSCLYENPTDLMFDNDKFGVGVMSAKGFDSLREDKIHYCYSWMYNDGRPKDDTAANERAEELIKDISKHAAMTGFIPEYSNQAIHFSGNDMDGDRTSIMAFLYITVGILAFIFAITTDSTITAEAGVIGTLRASGYTRGELVRHYLVLPMLTLITAAVIGNVLGYTFFEKYMAMAYLNSYSLTDYQVRFSPDAFIMTTAVPLVIMFIINLVTLTRKMKLSPLRFLRHDLSRRGKKKAFRLNTKIPIMTRFRLRVIFQNMPNYITIVIGTLLANAILLFGSVFNPMLENYQDSVSDNMLAEYIYVTKVPVETSVSGAEKGAMLSLETVGNKHDEDISVYGVADKSRYIRIDHSKDGVFLSSAYRDKYGINEGDTIKLKDKYSDKNYTFNVNGFYDYPASLAVFMDIDSFREEFELDSDYGNIYFSNKELDDIDDSLIASKITRDDLTKTSRQLMRSLGSIVSIYKYFGVIMFVLVIYLLAKIIIEKNTQSISMTKILGYLPKEVNSLYVTPTTLVTIAAIIFTIPFSNWLIGFIMKVIFMSYPGYFKYEVSPVTLIGSGVIGVVSYILVSLLLGRKVKKIPLAEALKNAE